MAIVLGIVGLVGLLGVGGCAAAIILVARSAEEQVDAFNEAIAESQSAPFSTTFLPDEDDFRDLSDELQSESEIDFTRSVPAGGTVRCYVTGIQTDGTGDYEVIAEITNASTVRSWYLINYELTGPDGDALGEDLGIISGVDPGETVADPTIGYIDGTPSWQDVTCSVTSAFRIPPG